MMIPLAAARLLLFATIVAGVAAGVALSDHTHKILVSLLFGICTGLLWRSVLRRAKVASPELWEEAQGNAAKAQEMIRERYSWMWRAGPPHAPYDRSNTHAPTNIEEAMSEIISIALAVCLAAFVWLAPEFWELHSGDPRALLKSVGAHLFALGCIATAAFGVATRLNGKASSPRP